MLVLARIEYALAIIAVIPTHIARLEKVQNEAMCIIFECTTDTSCAAMRYLLDFHKMYLTVNIWRVRVYLKISAYVEHLSVHGF
jgi:hypothetical protein